MTPDECQTCGNGMAVVRAGVGWCRRCGTVRYVVRPDAEETLVAVPRLAERYRTFPVPARAPESPFVCGGCAWYDDLPGTENPPAFTCRVCGGSYSPPGDRT